MTALGLQVGLKYTDAEKSVGKFLPNATKCDTWNDVRASHLSRNHRVVVSLDDVKGTLILLSIGLGVATITLFLELEVMRMMTKARKSKRKARQQIKRREGKQSGLSSQLQYTPYPPFII